MDLSSRSLRKSPGRLPYNHGDASTVWRNKGRRKPKRVRSSIKYPKTKKTHPQAFVFLTPTHFVQHCHPRTVKNVAHGECVLTPTVRQRGSEVGLSADTRRHTAQRADRGRAWCHVGQCTVCVCEQAVFMFTRGRDSRQL